MAYNYVSPDGVIVPDTSEIKASTEQEWRDLYGEDIDLNDETPQGMMVGQETAVRSELVANNAAIANQINPNIAGGIFLDDIWSLTGGKRRQATYTTVYNVLLGGAPGAIVPSGSRRATSSGNVFELISTVILDSVTGTGTGTFQALEPGPQTVPIGTLTVPVRGYTSVGWETSYNGEAGIPGAAAQSDIQARRERKETLALQGRSIAEAVYGNVRAVDGVQSISFRENTANTSQTIDGIAMVPHSVWACVDGGEEAEVALALYTAKTGGAAWNGAEAVDVRDPFSSQISTVKFDRPEAVPVMVRFTIAAGSGISDPAALIRSSVLAYANGQTDEKGFSLGEDVSPFELAAAGNLAASEIFIKKVEISPLQAIPAWQTDLFEIALNEKATITADNILVISS